MKFRKANILLACVVGVTGISAFTGCDFQPSERAEDLFNFGFDYGDEYYKNVEERYKLNYDEMIYDDFTGDDIDKSRWVVSDTVFDNWGADHNGMRPENVMLLKDPEYPETHLLLRANGSYYSGDPLEESGVDGINTAGCISTLEALGPGRYDIKMKPCPRIGALTSMWLFSWITKNDGSIQQNEIDIEIGLQPEFDKVYFTTWTAPDNSASYPVETGFPVNDGDWHIYSFDWVTDAEVPYVDYYIDGVKIFTIDSKVPTTNATLSIGMWVPSWSGGSSADEIYNVAPNTRMYDSDYAEISWWRYIPFQMGGWEQRPVSNRPSNPNYHVQVLDKMPAVNKCANGDFERSDEEYYKTARRALVELDAEIAELEAKIAHPGEDDDVTELKENLDRLISGRKKIADMLKVDPAPWKNYTVTDTESYFYIPGSNAEREKEIIQKTVTVDGEETVIQEENWYAKITNGGMYGQWLRAAQTGFKFRMTGRFKTTGDAVAALRFTNYMGFSTTSGTNGTETVTIGQAKDGWQEFSIEFTVTKPGTKGIRYHLINSAATAAKGEEGTIEEVCFDDIVLTYLGHN